MNGWMLKNVKTGKLLSGFSSVITEGKRIKLYTYIYSTRQACRNNIPSNRRLDFEAVKVLIAEREK